MTEHRDASFFEAATTRTQSSEGDRIIQSYFRGETSLIELHEYTWGEPIPTMVRVINKQRRRFRPDTVALAVEGWFYETVDDPEMPFGERKEYSPVTIPVNSFPKNFRPNLTDGAYFWAEASMNPKNKRKIILSNPRLSPAEKPAV